MSELLLDAAERRRSPATLLMLVVRTRRLGSLATDASFQGDSDSAPANGESARVSSPASVSSAGADAPLCNVRALTTER